MSQTNADELRPQVWDQYIGQDVLKEHLEIRIDAARRAERPLDHVLLAGPAGAGKSTLARIIAKRLGDQLHELTMPIEWKYFRHFILDWPGGVLFMDEIQFAEPRVKQVLLPLLERSVFLDRGRPIDIPWLTVVAATTDRAKLSKPLRERFPVAPEYAPYADDEMAQIVAQMTTFAGIRLDPEITTALGRAAAGTPRIARKLVLAARDLDATGRDVTAETVLSLCNVDPDGLSDLHKSYLEALHSQNGTAGLATLEMMLQLDGTTLREVERLLALRGMIQYTSSGRELTADGRKRLRQDQEPYARSEV